MLAAIIFVLPGLIIVGWWATFPVLDDRGHLHDRWRAGRDVHRPRCGGRW